MIQSSSYDVTREVLNMAQVTPYSKGPVIARRRRGDPTTAEMQLLAQCVRGDGTVLIPHERGTERSPLLVLAFEMQERGWLTPPGQPEVVSRPVEQPVREVNYREPVGPIPVAKVDVRVWRFSATEAGRRAYAARMESFGVKV